jgi:DNA-binding NarL/FixJ family response regulator
MNERRGTPEAPIRILIVDDDGIVRSALATYAGTTSTLDVVGTCENGAEAVAAVDDAPVDVVVMDVRMPVMDGITAAREIRLRHGNTRVLLLTSFDDDDTMINALGAGASGFLLKDSSPKALVDAIHAVFEGASVVSPEPLGRLIKQQVADQQEALSGPGHPRVDLSERELLILQMLCQAYSNAEIATLLFVSGSTVKTHVSTIMMKLGVTSRLKAVVRAYEWGLIGRGDT